MEKPKELKGRVINISDISSEMAGDMFVLMDRYFTVDRKAFEADLSKKEWVIILEDPDGRLRGFTSLALLKTTLDSKPVQALYSGDTIIDRDSWGSIELPRVWGRFMLDAISKAGKTPIFWFLLSSGYKTYRFLPVFFTEFFPRHDRPTPGEIRHLLDHIGKKIYGSFFKSVSGTVHLPNPTPLREGIADVSTARLSDPHVKFFVEKNPNYIRGVELACIAPLKIENLRPFIRRTLKA